MRENSWAIPMLDFFESNLNTPALKVGNNIQNSVDLV